VAPSLHPTNERRGFSSSRLPKKSSQFPLKIHRNPEP
jgi:hypothetical protein